MDELIRELKRLERLDGMELKFEIEPDAEGYVDKECADDECQFQFKVLDQDWGELFRDEEVFCPMCGKSNTSDEFFTTEQVEQAEAQALEYVEGQLGQAFDREAKAFNRRQPNNSFLQMSMEYKGPKGRRSIMPLGAIKEFQLKIECEECGANFAVIGSAFFCPCCGHSAAVRVFEDAMAKIEAKVSNLEVIRQAVAEVSEDQAAVICRSLLESGLSDGVVAFQRVCEQLYKQHPNAQAKISQNVFQRLKDGSGLWKGLIGKGYDDFLSPTELDRLNLLFERRHKFLHTEGIVDQKYIDKSGDTSYQVGQRIVVKERDVLDMVNLIRKLVSCYLKELGYGN